MSPQQARPDVPLRAGADSGGSSSKTGHCPAPRKKAAPQEQLVCRARAKLAVRPCFSVSDGMGRDASRPPLQPPSCGA